MKNSPPFMWRSIPERYNLIGSRCENCGRDFYPQRRICTDCRRKGKLVPKKMPQEGKIVSFTRVHVAPSGYEHESPYWLAIIQLSNGVRILSQVVDSADDQVVENANVRMVFRKIYEDSREGAIAYGYKFTVVP